MRLGSCVAVSAALLPEEAVGSTPSEPVAAHDQRDGTPVLITHGVLDDVLPRRGVDASAAALREGGAFVVYSRWAIKDPKARVRQCSRLYRTYSPGVETLSAVHLGQGRWQVGDCLGE